MLNQHGKKIIIIFGYKLRFHKILKNDRKKRWNCINKNCKSYTKTVQSGNTIIESYLDHNHEKYE